MDRHVRSQLQLKVRSPIRTVGRTARVTVCSAALLAACSNAPEIADPPLTTISDESADATIAPVESTIGDEGTTLAPPFPGVSNDPLIGTLTASVIDTHPHDSDAFTQGLEILDGRFVEGTGLYGESDRRIVDIESGEAILVEPIDADLFGEGITIVGDELLQITWKAGVVIRSDASTLVETGRDTYEGEGWGICFDGETLAMSNGSSSLTFRDPATFEAVRTVGVTREGVPVDLLNELECVNGQILANVWLSDLIVVIDPITGDVVATLDGSSLRPAELSVDDSGFALNGIAHDPETGHFFLTGKRWPVIYEVELS